jgi:hypothetical protein
MISTQELKATVSELSSDELLQFSEWFEEFMAEQWAKQIEADTNSSKLNSLINTD